MVELNFMEDCSEAQVSNIVHVTQIVVVVVMCGKILYVKKRGKSTLELPSVVPELTEKPADAVKRLMKDRLNAVTESVNFVTAYSRTEGTEVEYGMLYIADVSSVRALNDKELCASYFLDVPPEDREKWTYPETDIQLLDKAMKSIKK